MDILALITFFFICLRGINDKIGFLMYVVTLTTCMQTEDKMLKFRPAIDRPLTEPDFDTKQYLIARKDKLGLNLKTFGCCFKNRLSFGQTSDRSAKHGQGR